MGYLMAPIVGRRGKPVEEKECRFVLRGRVVDVGVVCSGWESECFIWSWDGHRSGWLRVIGEEINLV